MNYSLLLISIGLVFYSCSNRKDNKPDLGYAKFKNNSSLSQDSSQSRSSEPIIGIDYPEEQIAFHSANAVYRSEFIKAMNNVHRVVIHDSAEAYRINFFKKNKIVNWRGIIEKIEPQYRGAYASITISTDIKDCPIYYETGYGFASEAATESMIKADDPLFKRILTLRVGDAVMFSGKFICTFITDINADVDIKAVISPDLAIKFSSITKL
ncbi:MAG: hypothetical protein ACHQQQ_11080 [Bacteroidota bacterium]